MSRKPFAIGLIVLCFIPGTVRPGTYVNIDRFARRFPPTDPSYVGPYAIVHPIGYGGIGGTLNIGVCVEAGSGDLLLPLLSAIEIWNSLTPRYGNCFDCWSAGEEPEGGRTSLQWLVLHELGHCAMGLGHTNMIEIDDMDEDTGIYAPPRYWRTGTCDIGFGEGCGQVTSHAASVSATNIIPGATPGDKTELHNNACPFIPALSSPEGDLDFDCLPCCPACPGVDCPIQPMQVEEVSWFRRVDNNPVVIDSTVVIQQTTFSRSQTVLPAGSNSAASANENVAEDLGHFGTQSVMYSDIGAGTRLLGLAAEDTNMVRFGMTGVDRVAGTTDDYNVVLAFESDCANAEVELTFVDSGPAPPPGHCGVRIVDTYAQPGIVLHYDLLPQVGNPRLRIEIRADPTGSVYDRGAVVFWSAFETGNLLEWTLVSP
jgi:hypothetical protein